MPADRKEPNLTPAAILDLFSSDPVLLYQGLRMVLGATALHVGDLSISQMLLPGVFATARRNWRRRSGKL
jgi:hypothetical protein